MTRSKQSQVDRPKTGADFLQLRIADAPPGGLSDWLAERLRAAIADGRLPVGARLPATRVLAADLRVSRGVVTEAYQRLVEDGQVAGRGRAGTVVVAAPVAPPRAPSSAPAPASVPGRRTGTDWEALYAQRPGPEVFEALRAAPARIDLSPGLPDLAAFPRSGWLRAERGVLARLSSADLGYGAAQGTPALRQAVAHWLARNRGITAHPDEVVVVAGVAQALALFARLLREDGISDVAVEDPGSLGTRQQLGAHGVTTPPVPVDGEGIRVDELWAAGAAAVLVTPAHQFPMGVLLSGERRRDLLAWAADGGLVLEDDYDAEHRYDRPPVPALRALLPDQVCYAGSVSKWLAPALRIGWVLVPPRYRDAFIAAKRDADLGNPVLPQLVLAELMSSGVMERQLRFVRARHRRRRDAMIAAIAERLPGAVVHGAAAGLHLTVTVPARCPDTELAARALARGVKAHPLSWHSQRATQPGLVLGYAARTPTEIAEGVAALGAAYRELGGYSPDWTADSAGSTTAPT